MIPKYNIIMKALNHHTIIKYYLTFSFYMAAIVFLFVFMWICLITNIRHEGSKLEAYSAVLDNVTAMQSSAARRMDSLHNYLVFINSNKYMNDRKILSMVNSMAIQFLNDFSKMDEKDISLYRNIALSINKFLQIKDSIRIIIIQNDLVKNDLHRCITADRDALRKLSLEASKRIN